MSFPNPISAVVDSVAGGISKVASIFTPNKEAQAQRDSEARAASMAQYAAEFNVHTKRTWFDSIVDGLNRLVRPIVVYSVLTLFYMSFINRDAFYAALEGIVLVPQGFWTLLWIIVGFYFGGRHFEKKEAMRISSEQIAASRAIADKRKDMADYVSADEYEKAMADTTKPLPNKVIAEWNRRQREG